MSHAAAPQFALPRSDQSERSRIKSFQQAVAISRTNSGDKEIADDQSKPLVTFTFDDASASACSTGSMLLEQYKARATYYISGAGCGMAGYCGPLATTEQVKAL
jgi:hypothetical protein